jgi:hypothetical protein
MLLKSWFPCWSCPDRLHSASTQYPGHAYKSGRVLSAVLQALTEETTPQHITPPPRQRSHMNKSNCSCEHGGSEHSLHPCSCPNDRPSTHPMHHYKDAFHHVWCYVCKKYCEKCSQDSNSSGSVELNLPDFRGKS